MSLGCRSGACVSVKCPDNVKVVHVVPQLQSHTERRIQFGFMSWGPVSIPRMWNGSDICDKGISSGRIILELCFCSVRTYVDEGSVQRGSY
jgi:hypothetical protein